MVMIIDTSDMIDEQLVADAMCGGTVCVEGKVEAWFRNMDIVNESLEKAEILDNLINSGHLDLLEEEEIEKYYKELK